MSHIEQNRARARAHVVVAARSVLAATGEITQPMLVDICKQCGIHPLAFRALFPSNDDLLDAINMVLVAECADRLRQGVARFISPENSATALAQAATALAQSWPLDRGGFLIRARWRLDAVISGRDTTVVVQAERRFVGAMVEVFAELFDKLDRKFRWEPRLAVRIILDSYERSFEAWMLGGHDEQAFSASSYVSRTLPALLLETSAPAVRR